MPRYPGPWVWISVANYFNSQSDQTGQLQSLSTNLLRWFPTFAHRCHPSSGVMTMTEILPSCLPNLPLAAPILPLQNVSFIMYSLYDILVLCSYIVIVLVWCALAWRRHLQNCTYARRDSPNTGFEPRHLKWWYLGVTNWANASEVLAPE